MARGDSNSTGIAIVVGILGVSAIIFFMFKEKIMTMIGPALDLGLAPPPDIQAVDGEHNPIPMLKQEAKPEQIQASKIGAMRYYATRLSEELDKYQGDRITMTRKLNIESYVLKHYKSDLEKIVRLQKGQIKPLTGEALSVFSQIVLSVAKRVGVDRLPKSKVHQLRSNIGYGDMGFTSPASDYIVKNTYMRPS